MNKKYIYSREEYSNMNEELLGNFFKKIGNKIKDSISVSFAKNFGSYSKIEKLFQEFEQKIMQNFNEINNFRKKYIDVLKQKLAGNNDIDAAQIKNIRNQIAQAEKRLDNIKNNLYKQLDIKATNIIKDEKNPKVKDLITLKKLELEQRLEQLQYESVKDGIDDELLKAFPTIEQDLNLPTEKEMKDISDEIERVTLNLSGKATDNKSFNLESALKDDNYLWKESPYYKEQFKAGDKIIYFSKTDSKTEKDYTGSEAYISSDDKQKSTYVNEKNETVNKNDNQIFVTKSKDKLDEGYVINKGKIISKVDEKPNTGTPTPNNQSSTTKVNYSYSNN